MAESPNSGGIDRRQFRRKSEVFTVMYRVNSPATLRMQLGDKELTAIAQDISEGGMALLANHEMPAHSLITMSFIMFNDTSIITEERSRRMEVQGEVMYSHSTGKSAYRLGVRFTNISEADRKFIVKLVRANP